MNRSGDVNRLPKNLRLRNFAAHFPFFLFPNRKRASSSPGTFKTGIVPSSSHSVGPVRAACAFVRRLAAADLLEKAVQIRADIHGSRALAGLAATVNVPVSVTEC